MALLTAVLCALVATTQAVPWRGVVETAGAMIGDAEKYEPSIGIMTAGIAARDFQPKDAFPVEYCGWIHGIYNKIATCKPSSSCVWFTDLKVVGCCGENGDCLHVTSCVDGKSPQPSADSPDVYTCRGNDLCYTNHYPMGFTQVGCGKPQDADTVLTSYSGIPTDVTLQVVFSGIEKPVATSVRTVVVSKTREAPESTSSSEVSSTTSSEESSTTSSKESTTSSSNTQSTASSEGPTSTAGAASSSTSSSSGSKKSHAGAIAGGTVGGLAALGLIGALIFFFLRSRKKEHPSYDVSPQPPVAELESPTPGSTYPGTVSSLTTPNTNTPGAFSRPVSNLVPPKEQNNEPAELP